MIIDEIVGYRDVPFLTPSYLRVGQPLLPSLERKRG